MRTIATDNKGIAELATEIEQVPSNIQNAASRIGVREKSDYGSIGLVEIAGAAVDGARDRCGRG